MDTGSLKVVELLLIVGVVGYFYFRQRSNLQRLRQARESKRAEESARDESSMEADGSREQSD
jgi:hypothetical protein